MKKRFKAIVIFIFFATSAAAQVNQALGIRINHSIGNTELLKTDSIFILNEKDTFRIQTLKYYLCDFELYQDGISVWKEFNSYHLIDQQDAASMVFNLNIPKPLKYNQIKFNLGIDSATSNAGALGGVLDPSKGMYWSWQSGYINLKLEGKSSLCIASKLAFQLHLGGYMYPHLAQQKIVLNTGSTSIISINFQVNEWLNQLSLNTLHHIMSPGNNAVLISEWAAKAFSINVH